MEDASREEVVKRKQFALYIFETLAEYHLSQELIKGNIAQFIETFSKTLEDDNIKVKVSSIKAITRLLASIEDTEVVIKWRDLMKDILEVATQVLKQDQGQGSIALDYIIELTYNHPGMWGSCLPKLIFVVSSIMTNP